MIKIKDYQFQMDDRSNRDVTVGVVVPMRAVGGSNIAGMLLAVARVLATFSRCLTLSN